MRSDMGPGVESGTWEEGGRREVWDEGPVTGERGMEVGNGRGTDGRGVKEWKRDEKGRTVTVLTDIMIKN